MVVEQQVAAASSNSRADGNVITGAGAGAAVLVLFIVVLAALLLRARARSRIPQDWSDIFALIEQFKNKVSLVALRACRAVSSVC